MQMTMFGPRECPTATAEMLADRRLRGAIHAMRRRNDFEGEEWPFVEGIGELGHLRAWAVENHGVRSVVVGSTVFAEDDFSKLLNRGIHLAARAVFDRLDAGAA
ncbi:hypothetical protein [Bradyrhizobium australafricanum]|uniref:hypothetical protein n=1 Tax=Bradyrhizobium australafricanum TaxID=2821406 RepID=UPI001CE320FF|nr:hypothetical protein [Bradyrhizobium australafricanum]MCA6098152.1 hypothetical protein [Bradyrhizobium australafricanum]